MPPLWVVLALGCLRLGSGVNLQPQLASVTFATNNPTLTTVALEKPLCMFDSSAALHGTYEVYLYVLVDSASFRNASVQDSTKTPLSSTFQQTQGGRTGPYKAAAFDLTPCSDSPSLDAVRDVSRASEILNAYLIRVGTNGTCLLDPNFQGLCNPPLSAATEYRFKYVLVNMSSGLVQDQTLWSDPIRTDRLTLYSAIDTWPGRRSGGMIVITSILGSLPFFLLIGFAGAIVLSLVDRGDADGATSHDSQITQEAVPKSLGTSEPSYTSVNRGPSLDRAEVYASKLQD
ncbi:uroplakin-3a [Bos indicus]|uniref:Uroplakin-3a n=3 Tax=Bos TaxID=9903 RepID=UPK3A_BOVIN|nr:uroplakin-3a precursor [Bos taurus]P38574.1 RecName: Full=Uroplakin-3a; Short=UP3a; AltName: Full=Uroplakin III; Short=UPIII; Flags: Precursor [Bos taurus]AAC37309.1 uroplakin III [Bos taurus]DAA29023.1 TPA: uroplakin-3a-like [Bos taurus]